MDSTDIRIIGLLQADGRATYQEVAGEVGLSAPSVLHRVRRLERMGVIRGFTARIDPEVSGYPILVYVRVKPHPMAERPVDFVSQWQGWDECEACYALALTGDYLLRVRLRVLDDLESAVSALRQSGCEVQVELVLRTVFERDVLPRVSTDTLSAR